MSGYGTAAPGAKRTFVALVSIFVIDGGRFDL
jgi:hypothetical protein